MANGPVFFDVQSAARIANAVRKVEIGDRDEAALRFRRELPQQQRKTFRIATFTGAWSINATKTVTFKYQTNTPNTAVVTNLFFPVPAPAGATDCAIAKDGTAWFLIDVPLATATAVFVRSTAAGLVVSATAQQTVVSNVQIAATLNTANCAITVTRTQATASVTVISSTATSVFVSSSYTATYLTLMVS